MELGIDRPFEPDRNYEMCGRSFYFFDFDDNVAFLPTPMYLFHSESGKEVKISTGEYAKYSNLIGREGFFKDYRLDLCPQTGSFRRFRDQKFSWFHRVFHKPEQAFVEDIEKALQRPAPAILPRRPVLTWPCSTTISAVRKNFSDRSWRSRCIPFSVVCYPL